MTNAVNLAAAAATGFEFRNRLINPDFRIDQRYNGTAVTINTTAETYVMDQWFGVGQNDGVFTLKQDATVVPNGQAACALITISNQDAAIGSTQYYCFGQHIEGLNTADLAWGTTDAQGVALSFIVRSSVTGTFGGAIRNFDGSRSYPFTYTVSAANTWERKTIYVSGDTTGTWKTDTSRGVTLSFSVGTGSSYKGIASAWAGANYLSATGTADHISTLGATLRFANVSLEPGFSPTSVRRPYSLELTLCQRYYEQDDIPASGSPKISTSGLAQGTTHYLFGFKVQKRTTPTVSVTFLSSIDNATSAVGVTNISSGGFRGYNTISNGSFFYADAWVRYAASAVL